MAMSSPSSGGGKSGDVRAGGAVVEVSVKDSITKALAGFQIKIKAFAAGIREVGGKAVLAGSAVFAPLTALFKSGVDRAEGIGKLSRELGFTIEQMQRLQYAADVTGDSIEQVLANPGRYSEQMSNAQILDPQAIKDSTAANQAFRASIVGLQTALTPLVSSITPVVQSISEFIKNNSELVKGAFVVSAGVVGLGAAFIGVGAAISGALAVGSAVATVFGAIASVVSGVGLPIILAVSGVTALTAAFLAFTDTGKEVRGVFFDIMDVGKTAIGGIISSLLKGDLTKAFEIACAAASVVWKTFVVGITRAWVGVKNTFVETWRDVVAGLQKIIEDFIAWAKRNDPTGVLSGGQSDQQINAQRDKNKAAITADREKRRQEAEAFRNKQIEAARAERDRALAELNQLAGGANQPAAMKGRRPEDYMYFAGQSVKGAFRLSGNDQRQFSEGTNQAIDLAKQQVNLLDKAVKEVKDLNKNLRIN